MSLVAPVAVPYGVLNDALRTYETTTLERGVLDEKHDEAGIGELDELTVEGPLEKRRLVDVVKP